MTNLEHYKDLFKTISYPIQFNSWCYQNIDPDWCDYPPAVQSTIFTNWANKEYEEPELLTCKFIPLTNDEIALTKNKIYQVKDGFFKAEDGHTYPFGRVALKNKKDLEEYFSASSIKTDFIQHFSARNIKFIIIKED